MVLVVEVEVEVTVSVEIVTILVWSAGICVTVEVKVLVNVIICVGVGATEVDVEAVKVVLVVLRIVVLCVHDTATGYCCPLVGSEMMLTEAVEVVTRVGVAVTALQTWDTTGAGSAAKGLPRRVGLEQKVVSNRNRYARLSRYSRVEPEFAEWKRLGYQLLKSRQIGNFTDTSRCRHRLGLGLTDQRWCRLHTLANSGKIGNSNPVDRA